MTTRSRSEPLLVATPVRRGAPAVVWGLVATAVALQIAYPRVPDTALATVTALSVVVFALASVADVARRTGPRGAPVLLAVAGGGGLLTEALGVATGFPFGAYVYSGTLGPQLLGVPLVVPLAWTMMAWPALVVARTCVRGPVAVTVLGAGALAAWDLFLDPQMVAAGHWRWLDPEPTLPGLPGIPLTNFAGWLLVSLVVVGLLDRLLPHPAAPPESSAAVRPSGPASALYLWVYASSVFAHIVYLDLPGSALVGGVSGTTPGPAGLLHVAGDFTELAHPAGLMERASMSGVLAANAVVADTGAHAEPIYGVPPRGLLAGTPPLPPRASQLASWLRLRTGQA